MQNDVRDFTKEEAKQYKENLKKIYKLIGRNIFNMNKDEYTYKVKYPLGTYLYVVDLYVNPDDSSDNYYKISFEGTLIGILISQSQDGDNKVFNHYTIQNGCETVCITPNDNFPTFIFNSKEEAEDFCDNPTYYGVIKTKK